MIKEKKNGGKYDMGMEKLSHRERVLRAVNHEETDRYPIDLGMHFSSGISAFAYYDLRKYLGLSTDGVELIDPVQMLARVEDDVLERFHIDTKLLRPRWKKTMKWNVREDYSFIIPEVMNPVKNEKGEYHVRNQGGTMRMPEGGYFFDGDWLHISELEEDAYLRETVKEAEGIRANGDYFCAYMELPAYFGGLDFACQMLTDPEDAIAENEACHKHNLEHIEKLIRLDTNHSIDCITLNSDLGMQNAPFLSPDMYEEFCYPYLKKLCGRVHQDTDMKIFMHSCGSIEALLPFIVDAGVDIINPVQISAGNMEPNHLKEKYGSRICFWGGGCDTQNVLDRKTPEEVRENVKYLTCIFKQDSGFVFNQVHNIMGNVPPENIVAMFEAAYENSWNI